MLELKLRMKVQVQNVQKSKWSSSKRGITDLDGV